MARRNGRLGSYLFTDDYSGFTTYADKVSCDYWGSYSKKVLNRNLQEVTSPLGDPYPVPNYRGPQYEATTACQFETTPIFIGKTTRHFPQSSAYAQFQNLNPSIPNMSVGCTLVVH